MNIIIITTKIIKLFSMLFPAKPTNNKSGAPKIIAGNCCSTRLSAAGVSKLGSISLNKIIPVDAVPVNIPKIEKKASFS